MATTTAPTTERARTARREPVRIYLGCAESQPTSEYARSAADWFRQGLRQAANATGYEMIQVPASWGTTMLEFYAVRTTVKERRVIAEGLARFVQAAVANPELRNRYGRTD